MARPMSFCSLLAVASSTDMPEAFSIDAVMNIMSMIVLSVSWTTPVRFAV